MGGGPAGATGSVIRDHPVGTCRVHSDTTAKAGQGVGPVVSLNMLKAASLSRSPGRGGACADGEEVQEGRLGL